MEFFYCESPVSTPANNKFMYGGVEVDKKMKSSKTLWSAFTDGFRKLLSLLTSHICYPEFSFKGKFYQKCKNDGVPGLN